MLLHQLFGTIRQNTRNTNDISCGQQSVRDLNTLVFPCAYSSEAFENVRLKGTL